MNQTLKETLTNLTLGNDDNWTALLLFALFQVENTPYLCVLIPHEIMFFHPPPLVSRLPSKIIAKTLQEVASSDFWAMYNSTLSSKL